ncbi:MAG: M6 family metalloprotease domain-containing protein [Muribaculaceae bacterium]|nr:M6 family metalloprotease domain-containing protein [Muribaculaceae bacterium]
MKLLNIKRTLLLSATAAFGGFIVSAVPPMPGFINVAQPDGTTIEARIMGDHEFHYYELRDGSVMMADPSDGFIKPVTMHKLETLRAADSARREAARQATATRTAPATIKNDFPTTGTVKGLIVLAEFQDVKFQPGSTKEYFSRKLNQVGYQGEETAGSAVDYFLEQSYGRFTPEFDVVGPITLPKNRADYGQNEDLVNLFRDAALLADSDCGVNFADYDIDNDHFVDFFFVIFAGHGQAQGGPAESVWPAMKDVSDYIYDMFDDKYLGVAACSCELKNGEGTDLDGVGTVCHEFSHILGLPDIYDAQNTGGHGMGHYDMMCYGPYNGDMRVPSGYTAMDKFTLGWITPRVLDSPQKDVTLLDIASNEDCIFIVNPNNENEYYTLENRQLKGFDSALPGHGLVISYVNYNRTAWKKNTVNSLLSGYEHVSIMPADNSRDLNVKGSLNYEAGDPFPGTRKNTSFTDTSSPKAVWKASGAETPVGMAITNIRESDDGVITFDFMADQAGVSEIEMDEVFSGNAEFFTLQGIRIEKGDLRPGIYIMRDASGNVRKVRL